MDVFSGDASSDILVLTRDPQLLAQVRSSLSGALASFSVTPISRVEDALRLLRVHQDFSDGLFIDCRLGLSAENLRELVAGGAAAKSSVAYMMGDADNDAPGLRPPAMVVARRPPTAEDWQTLLPGASFRRLGSVGHGTSFSRLSGGAPVADYETPMDRLFVILDAAIAGRQVDPASAQVVRRALLDDTHLIPISALPALRGGEAQRAAFDGPLSPFDAMRITTAGAGEVGLSTQHSNESSQLSYGASYGVWGSAGSGNRRASLDALGRRSLDGGPSSLAALRQTKQQPPPPSLWALPGGPPPPASPRAGGGGGGAEGDGFVPLDPRELAASLRARDAEIMRARAPGFMPGHSGPPTDRHGRRLSGISERSAFSERGSIDTAANHAAAPVVDEFGGRRPSAPCNLPRTSDSGPGGSASAYLDDHRAALRRGSLDSGVTRHAAEQSRPGGLPPSQSGVATMVADWLQQLQQRHEQEVRDGHLRTEQPLVPLMQLLQQEGDAGRQRSPRHSGAAPEDDLAEQRMAAELAEMLGELPEGPLRDEVAWLPAHLKAAVLCADVTKRPEDLEKLLLLLDAVPSMEFDAFELQRLTSGHPLSALFSLLLVKLDLAQAFAIDLRVLRRFGHAVEARMSSNCYHNAAHVADVLQSAALLISSGGLGALAGLDDDPLQVLAFLFAAAIHDLEHPGLTGDFLVAAGHEWAVTYNDRSVLENHHIASAFRTLKEPGLNIFSGLASADAARLRRTVVEVVLATDMKEHFKLVGAFGLILHKASVVNAGQRRRASTVIGTSGSFHSGGGFSGSFANAGGGFSGSFAGGSEALAWEAGHAVGEQESPLTPDEQLLALKVAMKVADLGHLRAPLEVHLKWVEGLTEEFYRQGDAARLVGMPVHDNMRRECAVAAELARSQVGFFEVIALPLLRHWASATGSARWLHGVEENYEYWCRECDAGGPTAAEADGAASIAAWAARRG